MNPRFLWVFFIAPHFLINAQGTHKEKHLQAYNIYEPLWKLLTPGAREKILKTNYERLFDKAREDVRTWEQAHLK